MSKKNIILLVIAIILIIVAIALWGYIYFATNNSNAKEEVAEVPVQEEVSTFEFADGDGESYKITDFEDKPIMLVLWASDIPESMEIIETVQEKFYDDYKDEINFLFVNTAEKYDDIVEVTNEIGYKVPIYYDFENQAIEYYSYENLPAMIFIYDDGTISNQLEQTITDDSLEANLELLIMGNV